MERLLTHVRSRSLVFLSPTRQLSTLKTNTFDIKSRVLFNLAQQLDASKNNASITPLDINTRFPLPGYIGFSHETKSILKHELSPYDNVIQEHESKINEKELITKLNQFNSLEIRTHDCPSSVGSKFNNLFLNYDVLNQPLTAITLTFKTQLDMSKWSVEVENERSQLIQQFTNVAQEICSYLNAKQYWVDFIDPSNGKPYYGPTSSDALFETDERLQYFGVNITDLGCCRVIEHLQYGTHAFVGCIFTSASKMDPHIQSLIKDSVISN